MIWIARLAEEARRRGVDVDVAFVDTNPAAEGHEVTCAGCGRKAKLPFAPPPGKLVVCPDCMRRGWTPPDE